MIVEISFGLAGKISNLTIEKIHIPCECKILKLYPTEESDALIDLCPIHEKKYRDIESGKLEADVLIPGIQVDRE